MLSDSNMAYQYTGLPPGYVRLFRLDAGSDDDGLSGSLLTVSLSTRPAFEALSYVWGSRDLLEELTCDGHIITLTRNLAIALRRFRHHDLPLVLWVDQLCVDQSNTSERSTQINMINKIYSSALRVLMWLGPDPDHKALEAARFISLVYPRSNEPLRENESLDNHSLAQNNLPLREDPCWGAMKTLTNLEYWSRVWTMQEVMSATDARPFWGSHGFDWTRLLKTIEWAFSSKALWAWWVADPLLDQIGLLRIVPMAETEYRPLRWLLSVSSPKHASDKRDRVFAVLDLVLNSEKAPFQADYSRSWTEILCDTIRFVVLTDERGLESIVPTTGNVDLSSRRDKPWPTWVDEPMFNGISSININTLHRKCVVSASDGLKVSGLVTTNPSVLALRGVKYSRIGLLDSSPLHGNPFPRFIQAWDLARAHNLRSPYPEESLIEALLWTVLCGQADHHDPDEQMILRNQLIQDFISMPLIMHANERILRPASTPPGCFRKDLDVSYAALFAYKHVSTPGPFDSSIPEHAAQAELWTSEFLADAAKSWDLSQPRTMYRNALQPLHADETVLQRAVDALLPFALFADRSYSDSTYGGADGARFLSRFADIGQRMRFFVTDSGLMGMGPATMEQTDVVVVLFGGNSPFVLRRDREAKGGYLLVGTCYIYGIMKGEFIQELRRNDELDSRNEVFELY